VDGGAATSIRSAVGGCVCSGSRGSGCRARFVDVQQCSHEADADSESGPSTESCAGEVCGELASRSAKQRPMTSRCKDSATESVFQLDSSCDLLLLGPWPGALRSLPVAVPLAPGHDGCPEATGLVQPVVGPACSSASPASAQGETVSPHTCRVSVHADHHGHSCRRTRVRLNCTQTNIDASHLSESPEDVIQCCGANRLPGVCRQCDVHVYCNRAWTVGIRGGAR
jgi:hypothetical protein